MCEHIQKDGSTAIVFDTSRFYGVEPRVIYGICLMCGKNFKFVEKNRGEFVATEEEEIQNENGLPS